MAHSCPWTKDSNSCFYYMLYMFVSACVCLQCLQCVWFNVCVYYMCVATCVGVQERERHFNSATPLSPVTDKKSKQLNGTLSDTLYISIILWLKLRWHYRPAPNAENTYIWPHLSAWTFLNPFASLHESGKTTQRLKSLPFFSSFGWVPSLWLPGSC